jgi:hypothetical protein
LRERVVKPVRHFIVVCMASLGALASVMAVPPSSFLLNYAPPAPSPDRESRDVAGAELPAAASAAGGGG